jgi:hypothetical protein
MFRIHARISFMKCRVSSIKARISATGSSCDWVGGGAAFTQIMVTGCCWYFERWALHIFRIYAHTELYTHRNEIQFSHLIRHKTNMFVWNCHDHTCYLQNRKRNGSCIIHETLRFTTRVVCEIAPFRACETT